MEIIPRASKNTDAMTFLADGTVFFGVYYFLSVHCFDCSFVSGVKWWTHVSSQVMNRRKKLSLLLYNIAKHSIETSLRRCFCSIVSKRGTHLAYSSLMFEFSVNIQCKALFKIRTISVSSRTFSGQSSNTSSWQLVRPHLNSDTQYFIVVYKGAE